MKSPRSSAELMQAPASTMSLASARHGLRVLVVDDSPDDAALIVRALRGGGFEPTARQVDSALSMTAALQQEPWDIILCDYNLPGFDAATALDLKREFAKLAPLLIVSGTIGEEKAAELMRHGAADVILKQNVGPRLALAVRRELDAADARRRAAENEQRFRDIVEVAGDWIWETDPDHRFSFLDGQRKDAPIIRPAVVLGMTRWELAGVDPEKDALWSRHKADLDAHRPFRNFRFALITPDDGVVHMSVGGKPVFDEAGDFCGFRGTATDETAFVATRQRAERAEAQLHQAQKMEAIGQLTGGLAHDFNNLLQVIIGNLAMLIEDRPDDPEVQEFASEARDAARRGAELTRSLLAFARRQPLLPERVDVNQVVGDIMSLLRRTLGERIEVALALAPGISPVAVDPAQLQAALTNLATNARDAMSKGGRLTISTAERRLDEDYAAVHPDVTAGDYAMIEVSDTGSGMPPEVVARIFEPFFSTKSRTEGTGLGLSMVFGFVKQSGGHINVYSEPDVGTSFRLYLPFDRSDVEHDIAITEETVAAGDGETILVVEDDAAIRRLVVRQVAALGYRVEEAANAAGAIDCLESGRRIDLLFTDVVMAGQIDGFDLALTVIERWPSIRIVLTSGFPDTNTKLDSDLLSRVQLLTKPYARDDLARALRNALDTETI
jgi:signal transduction histidine kinase/DNA-binding response OmpR family regulator